MLNKCRHAVFTFVTAKHESVEAPKNVSLVVPITRNRSSCRRPQLLREEEEEEASSKSLQLTAQVQPCGHVLVGAMVGSERCLSTAQNHRDHNACPSRGSAASNDDACSLAR